ncbi:hypothetical protein BU15DRAFT_68742 [Melanogaster broomeanus]|nr:hypothetical protein BU15DRAFT_68742 [Melanogaster broomeanus]
MASTAVVEESKKQLLTFSPEDMNRYERPARICQTARAEVVITPFKLDYSIGSVETVAMSGNGASTQRVLCTSVWSEMEKTLTDANMDHQPTRDLADTFATKLWSKVDTEQYPEVELVIDILHDDMEESVLNPGDDSVFLTVVGLAIETQYCHEFLGPDNVTRMQSAQTFALGCFLHI